MNYGRLVSRIIPDTHAQLRAQKKVSVTAAAAAGEDRKPRLLYRTDASSPVFFIAAEFYGRNLS